MIKASIAPLDQLEKILVRMVQNLSIARAQIALDQLQQAVLADRDQIILIVAFDDARPDDPLAAWIAVHPNSTTNSQLSAAATVVHAGPLVDDEIGVDTFVALSRKADEVLAKRGARFVQWASDPGVVGSAAEKWYRGLELEPIANLDYLSGELDANPIVAPSSLVARRFGWQKADSEDRFADLVSQTYVDTLDCPQLTSMRTSKQSLAGYRDAGSFEPTLWFELFEEDSHAETPVGCMILSDHSKRRGADQSGRLNKVVELVYMGLIPSMRGRGLGSEVLQLVTKEAARFGANRLVMAVDHENTVARVLYDSIGCKTIVSETVWAKTIGAIAPE